MADNNKTKIWIQLADVKVIPLNIEPDEEPKYREAENLVNTLWTRWMNRFNGIATSQEVLARVAFQFARLYLEMYNQNSMANDFLTEFEKQLDDLQAQVAAEPQP